MHHTKGLIFENNAYTKQKGKSDKQKYTEIVRNNQTSRNTQINSIIVEETR